MLVREWAERVPSRIGGGWAGEGELGERKGLY